MKANPDRDLLKLETDAAVGWRTRLPKGKAVRTERPHHSRR
jgi:hypothetical protein